MVVELDRKQRRWYYCTARSESDVLERRTKKREHISARVIWGVGFHCGIEQKVKLISCFPRCCDDRSLRRHFQGAVIDLARFMKHFGISVDKNWMVCKALIGVHRLFD